jgi:hypothetical protein
MEELLKKLAEHFDYAAPFMYAAAAYGFFHWLDENASDEAKAALARTMRWKDYKSEQVASALVEVFDRIYTYPLLRWRAFFRSLLFTTVVSAIFLFEVGRRGLTGRTVWWLVALFVNVVTDYLSLFVIRPLLVRSGTKPVIGLTLAAASGAAIVYAANLLRWRLLSYYVCALFVKGNAALSLRVSLRVSLRDCFFNPGVAAIFGWPIHFMPTFVDLFYVWPALAVFVWLPLFALGILTARLLTPMSWIVGRAQWFLKEGKEHPLKAIGCVAAVVVLLGTVAGRAVFSA